MNHRHPHNFAASRRRRGFTLLEVVLAMAILLIGLIAVAAIFPVAGLLQKKTVDDIVSLRVAQNAQAIIHAKGLDGQALLDAGVPADGRVHPLGAALDLLPPSDRTYPPSTPDVTQREFLWVPLARHNTEAGAWEVYIVTLGKEQGASYGSKTVGGWANPDDVTELPGVAPLAVTVSGSDATRLDCDNSTTLVQAGDVVLDELGGVHHVTRSDATGFHVNGTVVGAPTRIWLGMPAAPGKPATTRRVMLTTVPAFAPTGFPRLIAMLDNVPGGGTQLQVDIDEAGTCGGAFALVGGAWSHVAGGSTWQSDVHETAGAGSGASYVTWTFTGLNPGRYRVWGTWDASPTRPTDAAYSIHDGTDATPAVWTGALNQQVAPGESRSGHVWTLLADTIDITGNTLAVKLTDAGAGQSAADALRIERVD